MSEGINWNDIGTVDVTFDGTTYHLGRPKMRQFRYFTDKLETASKELAERLVELQRQISDAEREHEDETTPEARAELDRLRAEVKDLNSIKFYDRTAPILAEMFSQLGDPLPEDAEDWPAWLGADSSLPGEILKHWRNHPKASGPPPPT